MGKERSNTELREEEENIISILRDNIISGIESKIKFLAPWQPWQKFWHYEETFFWHSSLKHLF